MGIDLSPEMIEVAKIAYPSGTFEVADLKDLERFSDHQFDYALCRSMKRMIVEGLGVDEWGKISRELLRVAGRIIVIEYEDLPWYEVLPDLGAMR